jgi:CheY-like chemotaxis protein
MKNSIPPRGHKLSDASTRRILLVDDNRDAANSLGTLLKFLGADVKIAYDGQSALESLRICRPSVILLDIGMPGLDGYEVARRIRQDAEFSHLVLIALTGWGQEQDRRRTRDAGFDHHLVKPVELGALHGLLASLENQQS